MSVDTQERKWKDEPAYHQLKAAVTNGKQLFLYTADDKKGQALPSLKPYTRIKVEVDYAATEKGIIIVRGRIAND
jgi:hypothetical protein